MKIAIASDHRGIEVKQKVQSLIEELGHESLDCGPNETESVDYPDFAAKVARMVSQHDVDRGILICGTGIGMCIAANKFPGVLAAPCHDELTAQMSRLHNNSNVLCVSADLLGDRPVGRPTDQSHGRDLADDGLRRWPACPSPGKDSRIRDLTLGG